MTSRNWLALVLGLGGCAAGAGDRPGESQAPWAYAVAYGDCAPWDGAATTISLSNTPLEANPTTRPVLRLTIYESLASVGGARWTIGESKPGSGMAGWCPPTGDCTQAGDGWIDVGAWRDGEPLRGRYRLRLADGSILTGEFVAGVLPRRVLCG
jgi:hypothetical protein